MLSVGASGVVCLFFLSSFISLFLSPSLWETARYGLKYHLKGPLNPKQQPPHLCGGIRDPTVDSMS